MNKFSGNSWQAEAEGEGGHRACLINNKMEDSLFKDTRRLRGVQFCKDWQEQSDNQEEFKLQGVMETDNATWHLQEKSYVYCVMPS